MMSASDYDVIVVGAGGAGLAAALAAAESGARVLVAESETRIGGSTRLSDAWLQAAGTSVQRRDGIADSPDAMFAYYMALNRWQVEPGLAQAYCHDAPEIVEWLSRLGIEFLPTVHSASEPVPRGHRVVGEGEALVATLERACRDRGVEIALGNRVERLIDGGGRILGIRAQGEEATAGAVVLAAGGFAHNPALIRRLLAGRLLAGVSPASPAAPGSRGDAIALGEDVGAALAGRDRAHYCPLPLVPPEVLLVTTEGRRFIDESVDHSVRTAAANYHGPSYVALFDESVRRGGGTSSSVRKTTSGLLFDDAPLASDRPPVRDWLASGDLAIAPSPADAAAALGIDRERIGGELAEYAFACAARLDPRFGKPPVFLRAFETPPFYAARIRPTLLVATFCGLRIDPAASVLDPGGRVIPGLYAAGECAGGVVGEVYAGHGNSITTALVFGRRAGRSAVRFAGR